MCVSSFSPTDVKSFSKFRHKIIRCWGRHVHLNGQLEFFEEFILPRNCVINPVHQKVFGANWNNDFWAVHASYRPLPERQPVKLTLFWSSMYSPNDTHCHTYGAHFYIIIWLNGHSILLILKIWGKKLCPCNSWF